MGWSIHRYIWNNSYVEDGVPVYLIDSPSTVKALEEYVLGRSTDNPRPEAIRAAKEALRAFDVYVLRKGRK